MLAVTFDCESCDNTDGYKRIWRDGLMSVEVTGQDSIGVDAANRCAVIGDASKAWNWWTRPLDSSNNFGNYYFDGDIGLTLYFERAITEAEVLLVYDLSKKFYQDCPAGKYCEGGPNNTA